MARNPYTKIDSNIVNHLWVDFPCPRCHKRIAISLGTLYRKARFQCTECHEDATTWLPGDKLDLFAQTFDNLYEQLQGLGLHLMFFHNPIATIWAQDNKS